MLQHGRSQAARQLLSLLQSQPSPSSWHCCPQLEQGLRCISQLLHTGLHAAAKPKQCESVAYSSSAPLAVMQPHAAPSWQAHRHRPQAPVALRQIRLLSGKASAADERKSTLQAKKAFRIQQKKEKEAEKARQEQAARAAAIQAKVAEPAAPTSKDTEAEEAVRNLRDAWAEVYTPEPVTNLTAEHVDMYFPFDRASVPEAFQDEKQEGLVALMPKCGCKGLQDEFAAAESSAIMFRACIHNLIVHAAAMHKKHIYLAGGLPSSGRSVAMAALVQWARSSGWLVMYVPTAHMLVDGGFFYQAKDGLWDTPESAKLLMHNMLVSHRMQLEQLAPKTASRHASLAALIEEGMNALEPQEVVSTALQLKDELLQVTEVPVLIAVDNYNVLYSHSRYYTWANQHHRRELLPTELRLAAGMRVFEQAPPANGVVVAASNFDGVSKHIPIPKPADTLNFPVQRFNTAEVDMMLEFYKFKTGRDPQDDDRLFAYYASGGNPKSIRRDAVQLLYRP